MSLVPNGILCISHITPNPLFYTLVEAGLKNIRVFHELICDYFHLVASASNTVRKEEVDRIYRYDTKLYRPRLVERPPVGHDEICIDLVDVVIPARDEVETIADVITTIQRSARVGRVIVVDNGSVDDTAKVAAAAGASVVHCLERGYGRAVKRGVQVSERQWVLKLDADVENTDAAWPERLIDCAIREKSRLAKAYWTASTEDPDRVTNFTAKPAFRIFFQELLFLHSPLSGIYLFDRHAFNFAELPNGFSFDVALLISALGSGQTISQAEIETVRHATIANGKRTYQHYYNMSDELLSFIVEAGIARLQ
jgi:glucosyl-3-phosphoglycerate synthase